MGTERRILAAHREIWLRLGPVVGGKRALRTHLEDRIAAFSISAAREAAWNNAEMFWALRVLPALRDRSLDTLDGMTAFAGKALLSPIPL